MTDLETFLSLFVCACMCTYLHVCDWIRSIVLIEKTIKKLFFKLLPYYFTPAAAAHALRVIIFQPDYNTYTNMVTLILHIRVALFISHSCILFTK